DERGSERNLFSFLSASTRQIRVHPRSTSSGRTISMRIVMLGTGPFAVPTLEALTASRHEVFCVITRPRRGRRPEPPPMEIAAHQLKLPVWQPETINSDENVAMLRSMGADLLVVCDYGEILKPPALAVARLGGINLHGSLLPKYRGAAPVQWAVLNGDPQT